MRLYGAIAKMDADTQMVWGYASTETVDRAGEVVLKTAIQSALPDYLEYSNIREMHQLKAVGTTEEAFVDDKGLYIGAHIVDKDAWEKVTKGVYKGFSIGGKTLARDDLDKSIITQVRLDEISLVDRPANPDARIDLWKAVGAEDDGMAKKIKSEDTIVLENDVTKTTITVGDDGSVRVEGAPDDPTVLAESQATTVAAVASEPAGDPPTEPEPAVAEPGTDPVVVVEEPTEKTVDPLARATAAVDALAAVVQPVTKKGMSMVSEFADLLGYLAWLVRDAGDEADYEGDGSQVPTQLRSWLQTGASIFSSMAQEEAAELLASVGKSAQATDLFKASLPSVVDGPTADGAEDLHKTLGAVTQERDVLQKTVLERDEVLTKLADRIEPLAKTVGEIQAENTELRKRLEVVEKSAAPAKTAGPGSGLVPLEKSTDSQGAGASPGSASEDDIAKALAEMSDEDRSMLLIKVAHQKPRIVNYR